MKTISRRTFLKSTAVASAAFGLPMFVPSTVFGADAPSNRIVIASIGMGGQGCGNTNNLMAQPDCQVVALCDVDSGHLEQARNMVNTYYQNKDCAVYRDFRDILARKDIDAVCISTPDHWHGLVAMAAAAAGKDIYCEKPLTNSIAEAKALKSAVQRYQCVFQTGSHERSQPKARYACELVRNQKIGKLHTMIVNLPTVEEHHQAILHDSGSHPIQESPQELDWNFWLGPTPYAAYTPKRCHFFWRFIMDYGGGEMTDRGAHVIDLGQLGNDTDNTTPIEFWAKGQKCDSTLYNAYFNFNFECTYANGVKMIGTHDTPRGIKFIGDQGWIFIHIHGGHLEASDPKLLSATILPDQIHLGRCQSHHRNFLDCVKTRQKTMAPIEAGYHTAVICHLLNASMRLNGARFKWDPQREIVLDNQQAQKFLTTPMRTPWHL
jgi:predicted dehydrogenase